MSSLLKINTRQEVYLDIHIYDNSISRNNTLKSWINANVLQNQKGFNSFCGAQAIQVGINLSNSLLNTCSFSNSGVDSRLPVFKICTDIHHSPEDTSSRLHAYASKTTRLYVSINDFLKKTTTLCSGFNKIKSTLLELKST